MGETELTQTSCAASKPFHVVRHLLRQALKMDETEYSIFIYQKIPWLTKAFFYLFLASGIILFLFGIYFLPSKHSSNEMKAAYFVLTTPEYIKKLFVIALLGTPTFYILCKYSRVKRLAIMTLFSDRIEIDNYKTVTTILTNYITNISCNDAQTRDGFPLGKLNIVFTEKSKNVIGVTLIDYGQSEELMDKLLKYENIKFDVSNLSFNPHELEV